MIYSLVNFQLHRVWYYRFGMELVLIWPPTNLITFSHRLKGAVLTSAVER